MSYDTFRYHLSQRGWQMRKTASRNVVRTLVRRKLQAHKFLGYRMMRDQVQQAVPDLKVSKESVRLAQKELDPEGI